MSDPRDPEPPTPESPPPAADDDDEPIETSEVGIDDGDDEPIETSEVAAEDEPLASDAAPPRAARVYGPSGSLVRGLAYGGMGLGIAGAAASLVPVARVAAAPLLALAVILVSVAAWLGGRRVAAADGDDDPEARFRRELVINFVSIGLTVVFLLLALIEALAIPAAFGQLKVFGEFALGFLDFYPSLIAVLLAALAATTVLHSRARPQGPPASAGGAYAALGVTSLFVLGSLLVASGIFDEAGVRAERSVFVLAAALVSLFFFLKSWLRLPAYSEVSDWLEREERLRHTGLIRGLVFGFLALSGLLLAVSLVGAFGIGPAGLSLTTTGLAMLALLGATFNVGVSHVVAALEIGLDNAEDNRKKRRVILNATSLGLTGMSLAVAVLTVLALLAQAAGVAIFNFLLEAYVAYYPVIFAVALVPLLGAVYVRTRVQTEVSYTDQLKALAMGLATVAIILVFFGVFIGSGFAQGTGIEIENAVLVMGGGVLALIQFVKARALLPGVFSIMRDAVTTSVSADVDLQESIKKRMMVTYVSGLLFVLGFTGYFVATSLGVVEKPQSSLGTDLTFFLYLLAGIVLLGLVGLRYFQGVNIDPAWAQKKKADIGKRRLTSEQVTRYLILGFSIGAGSLLFLVGLLITFGVVTAIGPFDIEKKYATDFFVFALIVGMGPYGWFQAREATRIGSINQKFPEFLRDLAESQRSGMTLTEAVITAAKGDYGQLTGEIRKMAAQIEWGVSFTDALARFGKRVNTQLIQRTVSLIIQASNAGGNVVDVLTAAADDSREIQMILKERKQSMSIYVMIIYIAFGVFLGVIAVLNAQFIPEVAKAVSKADGVSIGGLNFRAFDQEEFKTLFFHAAVIQGLGGGLVAGVMSGGKPVNGLRHSCVLVMIGWVLFRLLIG